MSDILFNHPVERWNATVAIPDGMRVPVEGETVRLPGHDGTYRVHRVEHVFGPDPETDDHLEPFVYVVLR